MQVFVNGTPAQIQFISQGQLNIVWPDASPGPAQFTVQSAAGQQTIMVIVAAAVPSLFTSGAGAAAARIGNIAGDPVVGPTVPLHSGDTVELYLTGLGQVSAATSQAIFQPTVTVGGQNCRVTYAGLVPGYSAFDQIDCQIPANVSGTAVPVIVTANGRASNTATLNIQ